MLIAPNPVEFIQITCVYLICSEENAGCMHAVCTCVYNYYYVCMYVIPQIIIVGIYLGEH